MVTERLQASKRNDGTDVPVGYLESKSVNFELEPANIAERLLNLNLVSSWTTSYAFAYCILDLYSSSRRDDFVAGLQSECDLIKNEYGGIGSKEAVDKMYRVDTAVRESLRISLFSVVALPRIVSPGRGLDVGDNTHIPPGVGISFPFQARHHDPSSYENPLAYDAFRFSRPFERPRGHEIRDQKRVHSASVGEGYITYGYGKHACPGRWLASQMLKQALAQVLLHYEVECVGPLAPRTVISNAVLPQKDAQVRIKPRVNA
ncbi:hypothetical protein ANO14919_137280 [Xylariales sp. No.14919]|nr:hypothetical protein ANO14919_137280 [Xylariales sp. No.14919]